MIKVGIAGLGAVGLPVARWLDKEEEAGLKLEAVSASRVARAQERMADFNKVPDVVDLAELVERSDLVVECLPPMLFEEVGRATVEAGKIFVPLSVTSLLNHMELVDLAKETGARIIVPTGALLGLDAVRAAAEGEVNSITMVTTKPPAGFKTSKFVVEQGIVLDGLNAPKQLYAGTVREAAAMFPANVNVSVALSMAGIGVDKTQYEVWVDPDITRNTHTIKVDAKAARFEMTIEGVPTKETPATGELTPLSVIATLRGLVSTVRVGS